MESGRCGTAEAVEVRLVLELGGIDGRGWLKIRHSAIHCWIETGIIVPICVGVVWPTHGLFKVRSSICYSHETYQLTVTKTRDHSQQ